MYIDLGAEKLLTAEKDNVKIAVEVKSFLNLSPLTDFYHALGQYQLYFLALKKEDKERILYLALPQESYNILKSDELLAEFLTELRLRYIIFNPENKKIVQWIN